MGQRAFVEIPNWLLDCDCDYGRLGYDRSGIVRRPSVAENAPSSAKYIGSRGHRRGSCSGQKHLRGSIFVGNYYGNVRNLARLFGKSDLQNIIAAVEES